MLILVGPVGGWVTKLISLIKIYILCLKYFDKICVTFACCNMQTREPHLVRELSIASMTHKLYHSIFHVSLSCQMQRCVTSQINIVHRIRLCSIWQQYLNDVHILFIDSILWNIQQLHHPRSWFTLSFLQFHKLTWRGVYPLILVQLTSHSWSTKRAITSCTFPWLIEWNMMSFPTFFTVALILF